MQQESQKCSTVPRGGAQLNMWWGTLERTMSPTAGISIYRPTDRPKQQHYCYSATLIIRIKSLLLCSMQLTGKKRYKNFNSSIIKNVKYQPA